MLIRNVVTVLGFALLAAGCAKSFHLSAEMKEAAEPTATPTITPPPSPTSTPSATPTPTTTPTPTPTPDPMASRNAAKVMITGHSLTDFLPSFLPNIVSSLGDTLSYEHQFIPGSNIYARARGTRDSTDWNGYFSGTNKSGSGLNLINEFKNPTSIPGRYDSLVIAERHDILLSIEYEDTVRYLRNYHDRFIAGNASAQTYFYEAWYNLDRDNPAPWVTYERQASIVWQCAGTRINAALQRESRSDRIRQIPAGAALAELVHQATTSTVAGITLSSVRATMDSLFRDEVHTTNLGSYYMSLVTYASLYRKAPTSAAIPSGVSATQAASLKTIAWNFISNYEATNQPRTLARCQDYLRDTFCTTFWNYVNVPSRAAGCGTHFTQQNSNNPFYFNSATDSAYWLPAPPGA